MVHLSGFEPETLWVEATRSDPVELETQVIGLGGRSRTDEKQFCRLPPWASWVHREIEWRALKESNLQPLALEATALPVELSTLKNWRKNRDSNSGAASLRPSRFQRAPIDHSGIFPKNWRKLQGSNLCAGCPTS